MIIVYCPNTNCKKLIVLPFDSKDVLENDVSHIECVHCHRKWSVNDLFHSMNDIFSEPSVLHSLTEEINSFNTTDEICNNIHNISQKYCVNEQVVKEFANIEIAKRKKIILRKDLLHFVELKNDQVSLSYLMNTVNKAIKQSKECDLHQLSVSLSRTGLEKQIDYLQQENRKLKKELNAMVKKNETLNKKLEKYL